MKIQVLGTGCHNCIELERRLAQAISMLARDDIAVERIDNEQIIRHHMPLDELPGLLIDGSLVSEREVPDLQVLIEWIRPAGKHE